MKKVILLLTFSLLLFSMSSVKAQSFDKEPVAFLHAQLVAKFTVEQIKKSIPKGYALIRETEGMVVFEKAINDKYYEIFFFIDDNGKMKGFIYQTHTINGFDIIDELKGLGYTVDESMTGKLTEDISLTTYRNSKLKYNISFTDDKKNRVCCVIANNTL